jgi:hypothetical protein
MPLASFVKRNLDRFSHIYAKKHLIIEFPYALASSLRRLAGTPPVTSRSHVSHHLNLDKFLAVTLSFAAPGLHDELRICRVRNKDQACEHCVHHSLAPHVLPCHQCVWIQDLERCTNCILSGNEHTCSLCDTLRKLNPVTRNLENLTCNSSLGTGIICKRWVPGRAECVRPDCGGPVA